ncbi:MAG: TetR/AcrR family transcriptional regulator [Actinobacteria bacterium]|nr:TetR/AcrR family transcriptional regulator [Actinomycetota bacterium]
MPSRRPLPRGTLTPPLIVGAALELIDAEGLDGLTMRRLAGVLGCEAMSLYKHVADKATLLTMVIDEVMADFRAPDTSDRWDDRLRAVAGEVRRLALAHPHLFPLVAVQLPASSVSMAPVEALLGALSAAGLDDDNLMHAFWALVAYLTGALLAETAAVVGVEQPFPFELSGEEPTDTPHVARLAGRLAASDYAVEFESGLQLVLDSIAVRASESSDH